MSAPGLNGGIFGGSSGGSGTIGGSTGATDNAVLRADGTGGSTIQSSAVTISDTGNLTIPAAGQLILAAVGGSGQIDYLLDVGVSVMDSDLGVTQQHDMSGYTGNHTVTWPDTTGTVLMGESTATTVGVGGVADALPLNPVGYVLVRIPGYGVAAMPYYAVA